jgi:cytidine deaminase
MCVLRLIPGCAQRYRRGLDPQNLLGITSTMHDNPLLEMAQKIAVKAHAPYSRFYVGAAAQFSDGKIYCGVNVENKSYGLTICAERSAIFAGIAAGSRKLDAIAVCSLAHDNCYPCGACLQVIAEFGTPDTKIFVGHEVMTLNDVLPKRFEL